MLVHDRFRSLAGRFSTYLLAFAYTKWEFFLYIKNLEPKVIPDESTIPTYMRYYPTVLSKFACATSKISNKYPFCVPGSFSECPEVVDIFHAKRVILRSSVYSLTIAREKGGNMDAQSQTANMKKSSSLK